MTQVRMNCDALAPHYHSLEYLSFGAQLDRSRVAFLREVATSDRAIIAGGGDGRFLARLLRVNARVEVDFVELSKQMLGIAERRIAAMGQSSYKRVHFWAGDLCDFQPRTDGYDLIVTNFFLDCFSEKDIEAVVARLAGWSSPDARWVLSDFRESETSIGRMWTGAVIRGLYAAFRFATGLRVTRLPNYTAVLASAGFALQWEERWVGGLLHSSLWRPSPVRTRMKPSPNLQARP